MNTEVHFQTPTAAREARWFYIPGIFGALLFLSLLVRWWPAAVNQAHGGFGIAQVLTGDLILLWKSFQRCAIAYVLTAIAFDWLKPIRWTNAFVIAAGALFAEIAAESLIGRLFGSGVGVAAQLVTSAVAYALTLWTSLWILRRQ